MDIKIIIADDHTMFRKGLIKGLESESRISIVGEAGNGKEIMELTNKFKPHLILMDITLLSENGIDIAKDIKNNYPEIKILILSMHLNPNYIFDALSAKLNGYVSKMSEMEELIEAIFVVAGGGKYFSKDVKQFTMENYYNFHKLKSSKNVDAHNITRREKQIIKHISDGLNYKEIAKELSISPFTVINHRQNIIQKLGLKNNAELIHFAIEHKLN